MNVNIFTGAERLPALDLMRFIAATSVMVYHYTYHYSTPTDNRLSLLGSITRHGYLGVQLFFIISGFVILWSARKRSGPRFVRARILRLFPEFWISVVLSTIIFRAIPAGFGQNLSVSAVLLNLTMLPQYLGAPYVDGVYWTLGVEMKFYFLVFIAIVARQIHNVERWLYAWIAVFLVASVTEVGSVIRSLIIFPYGSFFAAGGMFFLVHESGWNTRRSLALTACLSLCVYHAIDGMSGFIDEAHITTIARATTATAVTSMFAFFALVVTRAVGSRYARAFATAGALTYPLYLLHNSGKELFFFGLTTLAEPARVMLAATFSFTLAYAVFRFSDRWVKPALRKALDQVRIV